MRPMRAILTAAVVVVQGCGGSVAAEQAFDSGSETQDAGFDSIIADAQGDSLVGDLDAAVSWWEIPSASPDDIIIGGGSGPNDVWTISLSGGTVSSHRWDGSSWQNAVISGGLGEVVVAGAPNDVLLGFQEDGKVEHWDGAIITIWRPFVGSGLSYGAGLFIGPDEFWLGGGHSLGVEHWRSGAMVGSFNFGGLPVAMAGSGAEAYAVVPTSGGDLLAKWDGSGAWVTNSVPFDSNILALGKSASLAVGDSGVAWFRGSDGTWSKQSAPTSESLRAIDDDNSSDIWVVGAKGTAFRFQRGWRRVSFEGVTEDLTPFGALVLTFGSRARAA